MGASRHPATQIRRILFMLRKQGNLTPKSGGADVQTSEEVEKERVRLERKVRTHPGSSPRKFLPLTNKQVQQQPAGFGDTTIKPPALQIFPYLV